MSASGAKSMPTFSFLTVIENDEWGMTGGLLVLNASGRPLEFHCTAPLKPNRAQEILYGPTLRPFLYGEQIGQTLLGKAKSDMLFVCTDVEPALCVRDLVDYPVALMFGLPGKDAGDSGERSTASPTASTDGAGDGRLVEFALGGRTAAVLAHHAGDKETILERWKPHAEHVDLHEPFGRIREALAEAQRGATK
ncbi:MAG: hypothetical protein AB7O38_09945 [Pirellulaceae bacterium]